MGMVYLSQGIFGADQLDDVLFRFESFDAGNDYVREAATQDDNHIKPIFNALKWNWSNGCPKSYIDDYGVGYYDR